MTLADAMRETLDSHARTLYREGRSDPRPFFGQARVGSDERRALTCPDLGTRADG